MTFKPFDLTDSPEGRPAAVRNLFARYRGKFPLAKPKAISRQETAHVSAQVDTGAVGRQVKRVAEKTSLWKKKANHATCRRRRAKVKASLSAEKVGDSLHDAPVRRVVSGIRGNRTYAAALSDRIARIGSAPSAGGARVPLAGIISMAKDREMCLI